MMFSSDESDNEMFEAGIFDSDDDSDALEDEEFIVNTRVNHMNLLMESEFTYRFRLNKSSVYNLLTEIVPLINVTSSRNFGISPLHQLLLTLRFFALGTMLVSVADFIGVSKTSASRIVRNISQAIASLYPNYVKMLDNTASGFYDIASFPRVLGVIDGTHVPIQSPNSSIGEQYRNRKGIFSLNVQAVCNFDLIFMHVDPNWPGATQDATIFDHSELKVQCEDGLYGNRWLLGDSAYPCSSYLLTPLPNPIRTSEQLYNETLIKTRSTIERCFCVWKRRFPVLSYKVRLELQTTQAIIKATSVLHNICIINSIQEVEPEVDFVFEDNKSDQIQCEIHDDTARQELIYTYFSRLN